VKAPARSPRSAVAVVAIAVVLFCGLGLAWQRDRRLAWERPRWTAGLFEPLAGGPDAIAPAERHVVAVNPLCPHCLVSLDEAVWRRRDAGAGHRIAVLIVDTAERPRWGVRPDRGEDEVWWDAAGVWRRRWGHRVYGEVLVFDAAGKWLRTLPPPSERPPHLDVDPGKGLGVPPDDL